MKFVHHFNEIELLDEWWQEAGLVGFVPNAKTYRVDQQLHKTILEVRIADVGPLLRKPLFRDGADGEGSARERVVRILRGFRLGENIPPVEVVEATGGVDYRYKLTQGAHRFYCSLAAGFTHVPAVTGFDIAALDI